MADTILQNPTDDDNNNVFHDSAYDDDDDDDVVDNVIVAASKDDLLDDKERDMQKEWNDEDASNISSNTGKLDYQQMVLAILLFVLVIAVGVGLGLGVRDKSDDTSTPTTSAPGVDEPACSKAMTDFNTDNIVLNLMVKMPQMTETSSEAEQDGDADAVPGDITALDRDLLYVSKVFQKTYDAFTERASIMKGRGCDPYCRHVEQVVLVGFEGPVATDYNQHPSSSLSTRQTTTDGEGECVPVQVVLGASGTFWTACDVLPTSNTKQTRSSPPGWPGLFGDDDVVITNRDADRGGWTRRLYDGDDAHMGTILAAVSEKLTVDGISEATGRSFLRQTRRVVQRDDLDCPVCPDDSIQSFSTNDFNAVMSRFVSTLPSICSIVSINEV